MYWLGFFFNVEEYIQSKNFICSMEGLFISEEEGEGTITIRREEPFSNQSFEVMFQTKNERLKEIFETCAEFGYTHEEEGILKRELDFEKVLNMIKEMIQEGTKYIIDNLR